MVEEEHEVTDDEPEPPVAPVKAPAAAETSSVKGKSKQASIMGFFGKKPAA
jgi:hypothetical protein